MPYCVAQRLGSDNALLVPFTHGILVDKAAPVQQLYFSASSRALQQGVHHVTSRVLFAPHLLCTCRQFRE